MIVFRLAKNEYAYSLRSSGAPNRWNCAGQQVIYASSSISLCALELLAHTSGVKPAGSFHIMNIEIEASVKPFEIASSQLPNKWSELSAYSTTQNLGSNWYESMNSLCMKVPSAVVPSEYNFLINTIHPHFSDKVKLLSTQDFFWDNRFPNG